MHIMSKYNKFVLPKDLTNLKNRNQICEFGLKNVPSNQHGMIRLKKVINERIVKDNNVDNFKFVHNNDKEILALYYQNQNMRELYAKYGDMLFVDSTYKLNNHQYPCFIMAIKDNNNNAHIVAAALMAYERKELMKEVIQFFVDSNANYTNRTKNIMIDKDLKEDDILQQNFPQSQLLFCHFHVIKIFERYKNKITFLN